MSRTLPSKRTRRWRVSRRDNGLLLSPAEFDAIDDWDENYSYELINGVLVVNPVPGPAEVDPNEELGSCLRNYGRTHPGHLDKTLPERYVATANCRRRCDRAIWAGFGRVPLIDEELPTIVVEFVSERRRDQERDYLAKRDEYMALGIREYWVIDRFRRALTVFRKEADGIEEQVIQEHEVYRPALLPGFELPLAILLQLADDWIGQPRPKRAQP